MGTTYQAATAGRKLRKALAILSTLHTAFELRCETLHLEEAPEKSREQVVGVTLLKTA